MPSISSCPICSFIKKKSIYENLYKCLNCKVIYNTGYIPVLYNENYFTDQYKFQYGVTYAEDFETINRISKKRLDVIIKLLSKISSLSEIKILDIGAAMGFFLNAAKNLGFNNVTGCEISKFACEKSKTEFGLDIANSSFDDFNAEHSFDIITAWFFIEHTEIPAETIKKIYSMLNKDGIFAFSVPSYFGPQYLFNKKLWGESFPLDHKVEFSPLSVKKILKAEGFKRIIVKPAGFHPERIVSKNSLIFPLFSILYKCFTNITAFSDTIEVYAVK